MNKKLVSSLLVVGVAIIVLLGISIGGKKSTKLNEDKKETIVSHTKDDKKKFSVVKSSLYGFVVGDAMGVPIEFNDRESLMKNPVKSMLGYGTYNVPEGTWSDDTSMTLATMDSIIKCNKNIDVNDLADRFCNWFNNAEYTATGDMFDIGNQTKGALTEYQEKRDNVLKSGSKYSYGVVDVSKNGNGSLMRMLPVALYCYYENLNDEQILNVVKDLSSITHPHERSLMGCYIYVRYVMYLLDGKDKIEAYNMVKSLDYSMFSEETNEVYARILKQDISKLNINDIKSTGNVVCTLEAVFWVTLNSNSYNESIITAINLGEDTDTIGAITGSITGLIYGYDNINSEWIDKLRNKEYLDNIIVEFENTLGIKS